MIKDAINITDIHFKRLKMAYEEIKIIDLGQLDWQDFDFIKLMDTFIFRFIKLQDYMGGKLFKVFLMTIGDYKDEMSFIDILDRLEKLHIIDSTEDWLMLRKLRNKLAHEYPDQLDEIKKDIEELLKYFYLLEQTYNNIKDYLRARNLLNSTY